MISADFLVHKSNLQEAEWREYTPQMLQEGEVRLKISSLALTANNVTYAAFADFAGYWNFFPTEDAALGRVPFWGFADVAQSKCAGVEIGQRYYGYLPASSELIVQPGRITPFGFTDISAHRKSLPGFYNILHLTETDSAYKAEFEDIQMLIRPLYATGWLIDDYIRHPAPNQARQTVPNHVIVSSASAKTSLAYASVAKKRGGMKLTGLTSPGNIAFTEASGFYDTVISYEDLDQLPQAGPALHVDIRGTPALRPKLEAAAGGQLMAHLQVGATDWEAPRKVGLGQSGGAQGAKDIRAPNEVFFAPGHVEICAARMGPKQMQQSLNADMCAFYPKAAELLTIEPITAYAELVKAWQDTVTGKISPTKGLIVKFD